MRRSVDSTRRAWLAACTATVAFALTGCAAIGPRHVTLSQSELQALLEKQFPREQRLMELIDMRLSKPVVKLLPDRNRLGTEVELSASERITGRALKGNMALDYGLRYEPTDATLRLANVRVQTMNLDVGGTPLAGQTSRLGALLAERLLDDFVIYRVSPERREMLAKAGIASADIAVTSSGVELKFAEGR